MALHLIRICLTLRRLTIRLSDLLATAGSLHGQSALRLNLRLALRLNLRLALRLCLRLALRLCLSI